MAEAALLGVAKSVLGQLSSPALKEFLLVWNFKKDLKRLAETIEALTCFIYDAEQRQSKERLVRMWLSRLRAVLYEADDLFDAIGARALHKKAIGGSTFKKEVTLFFSKSNHLSLAIKTASDIKAIRECLDGIKDDMSSFQFQYQKIEEKRPHSVLEREERHSFVDKNEVIGRDQEREDIVSLLLSEGCRNQNLEVISVIGFGGLGKTTLAQLVYNDERVQKGFDMCLWTCINYLSDLELVLVKILESKPHEFHLDQLQRELREKIQGKKYLLVLDDVWDENASNWDKFKILLNCGKIGSKVLVTTRKTRVAQCLDAIEPYYRLNTLSFESAWSLFVKMAFKDGEFEEDPDLVLVGKQILEKCGFVPLALTTIGRMLRYRKKDKEEWLSFLEKEFAEVVSSDVDDGNLMQVLKIIYNDLPLAVKHCFAYCSVFPKDHQFDRDELVRMWIAQGFVESHAKKSLEEVGDDYFFYMVDRCFFQDVRSYGIGDVRYVCQMHDLLHDLAIQVAESGSNSVLDKDLSEMVERSTVLHHISITFSQKCSIDFSNSSFISKSLRTLRFVNAEHIKIDSLKLVLDRFTKIRTLVLQDMEFQTLPDIFEGLIHLRYLDLSKNSYLISLPNLICKLYRLQTLLLTSCVSLVELPSNLNKLVSLRHLVLKRCMKLDYMPSGLASLSTLVNLDRLIVHPKRGGLRYLGCLNELCGILTLELPVNGWVDCVEDARKANLQRKYRLSGVSITCSNGVAEGELSTEERRAVLEELEPHANIQNLQIGNYIGDKLPSWFSSLPNLKQLSLEKCDLEFIDVGSSCAYLLPRLEVLELRDMPRLKGWCSEAASPGDDAPMSTVLKLPRLSTLEIVNCGSLVGNMPICEALEELTLEAVNVRLLNTFLSNPNAECSPQRHDYISELRYLFLERIEGLECLSESSLQRMTALKRLSITSCESLIWMSRRGLACLTSLESLDIVSCGGVRLEDEDDRGPYSNIINNFGLQRLRCLTMPWQSHFLREYLHLLPSLQYLRIEYFEEHQVETDNEDLECCTRMWWQGSKKLEGVELSFGYMACCFPNWVLHLPGLTNLGLVSCSEMNTDGWVAQQTQSNCLDSLRIVSNEDILWIHDIPWNLLPSLRALYIYSDMNTIPSGVQQIPSLRSLEIWSIRQLKEIPRWMMNLNSLQDLSLSACSPDLKLRCEPEVGADWHLISHIPNVRIY